MAASISKVEKQSRLYDYDWDSPLHALSSKHGFQLSDYSMRHRLMGALIVAFTGPGILGMGIWLLLTVRELDTANDRDQYELPVWTLLITGGAVIMFGILGCIAVFNEHRCLLTLYFLCLLAVITGEVLTCVKSFLLYDNVESHVTYRLNITIRYKYQYDEDITQSFDSLQQQYHCCGIHNWTDWSGTNYNIQGRRSLTSHGVQPFPASCCWDKNTCNLTLSAASMPDIFPEGCLFKIANRLHFTNRIVGWSTLACAAFLIIGVSMVCCFRLAVR